MIKKFYNILKGRIKIIGVGGVDSGKSAYEKFLAGANYVQLYTGMVFRGPNIVNLIKNCLLYTSPSPRDNKASRMPSSA